MSNNNERSLSVRSNDETRLREVTLGDAVRDITSVTAKDDTYNIKGKRGYNAKFIRQLALKQGIRTRLADYGKDADKTWIKVEAWKGSRDKPTAFGEVVIIQRHQDSLREAIFDAISNGITVRTGWDSQRNRPTEKRMEVKYDIGPDGFPRLTDAEQYFIIMKNHLHEISIIERKLTTIAIRNAQKNLLEGQKIDDLEEEDEDETNASRHERGDSESPTENKTEAKPQETTSNTEQGDLVTLRKETTNIILKIAGNNAKLAKNFLFDVTNGIEGMIAVDDTIKITTVADMKKVLVALKNLRDDNALEIEPEQNSL